MTWYSQAGQSAWVHSIVGDSGFFVDVGAYDGIEHSNTYALEQLGWDGLCIEPLEGPFGEMTKSRSAKCLNIAVSDHDGAVMMDGHRVVDHGPWTAHCRKLSSLNLPPVIDYLSIDVEGHELQVLAGMDFDRWHVRLITIEHNLYCDGPDRKNAIYAELTSRGFVRVREDVVAPGYGPYEDWYVNDD